MYEVMLCTSRLEKKLQKIEYSWDTFKARCNKAIITSETISQWDKMPKNKRDNIKDVGGFIAGLLKNDIRKKEDLVHRCMLTIDIDKANTDIWDILKLIPYMYCIYTTHNHRPENPRIRLIVPLSISVTPDKFKALSMAFTDKFIPAEYVDKSCFEPCRLMYWPSISKGAEFRYLENDFDDTLDPDIFLNDYYGTEDSWKDISLWPYASMQELKTNKFIQTDPRTKTGVIGMFCKSYSIDEVINLFLADIYEASEKPDRYSYIPADSTSGVIVYEDLFTYSHHASDPSYGKLCNAFDLVRAHKFGLGTNTEEEAQSVKDMISWCISSGAVKELLCVERYKEAFEDFADMDWYKDLDIDSKGFIKCNIFNLEKILEKDSKFEKVRFNEFTGYAYIDGKQFLDKDMAEIYSYLDKKYGFWNKGKVDVAFETFLTKRTYHPVKEYLENLPAWDGIPRVETLLVDMFNAEDSLYIREITKILLSAAVRRIYTPGVKYDYVVVLSGPQGIGKSYLLSLLGGEWFTDSIMLTDTKDKTAAEKLRGMWIVELSEMAGYKKADLEKVKGFVTTGTDRFRPAYAKYEVALKRQAVFVGTTNDAQFLFDYTGNRRFLPVYCYTKKYWPSKDYITQVWAEVLSEYKDIKLYLEDDVEELANKQRYIALDDTNDDKFGLVEAFLHTPITTEWEQKSIYDRRDYYTPIAGTPNGTVQRTQVSRIEILAEGFNKDPLNISNKDIFEIKKIMLNMPGWKQQNLKLNTIYGRQRYYTLKG